MTSLSFSALVPVKPLGHGKSRLADVDEDRRRALAHAFLADTLDAVTCCPSVTGTIVVTDDFRLARQLRERCVVIPDGVSGDLNATLEQAAAEARRRWPEARPVAVCADLPALSAEALDVTLAALAAAAPQGPAFVPDADGSGTTLYSAPHGSFTPGFGFNSRGFHVSEGAVEVTDVPNRVRLDVDTSADLERALALGCGPATTAAAAG
ncbi:2-phospho-L-lactate guanylyltransferase [Nocardioides yefusunii]|uniref:2-phospho-L-lactate guanylyltransferase n=1 Tax=Nocardioides yefusunii TaxID=2500546 RepID=A0ABW1R045_9ACTN|nr:2-phospho-L-lactate guanylyltransferase [Nocardioides yefusunii]